MNLDWVAPKSRYASPIHLWLAPYLESFLGLSEKLWQYQSPPRNSLQHVVYVLSTFLNSAIPDVPNNLKTQLLRERQLQKEVQFEKEQVSEQPEQLCSKEHKKGTRKP